MTPDKLPEQPPTDEGSAAETADDTLQVKDNHRAELTAQPPSRWRRLWPPLVLVVLLLLGGVLIWQHDAITDWVALRGYQPAAGISQLAADDQMTSYAKRLFYVNHPALDKKEAFNGHCTNTSDQVVVLGCYTGNRNGIYLYDVTDPRLSGVEQVTAAHEMLHQAYERLSASERQRTDKLLTDYAKQVTDPDIKSQLASYQKTEPDAVVDEMHSVFGTEVTKLPPELEQYYARYFANRPKIAAYYEQYQSVFTQRQQQIASYDAQLKLLGMQIDANKTDIAAKEKQLQSQHAQLDAERAANQIDAYNAGVPGYNNLVAAYKAEIAATNTLVGKYNSLVGSRNAIAVQEQQLQQELNSHATSSP